MLRDKRDNSFENITLNNVKIIGKNNSGGIIAMSDYGNYLITLKNMTFRKKIER